MHKCIFDQLLENQSLGWEFLGKWPIEGVCSEKKKLQESEEDRGRNKYTVSADM